MMKLARKAIALVLALCLLLACAAASASGLGDFVAYYLDVNNNVRFSATAALKTVMPFNDDTVALLNGVLKHIRLGAQIESREAASDTAFQLSVDDKPVLTINESEGESGSSLTTSLLPNRTLVSAGSALDVLLPSEEETAFDALSAISEVKECYKALTDAIMPYASEQKANYRIKNIGLARWSRVAKLDAERSAALLPQIAQVLSCGMDAAYRTELEKLTCAEGFTVALYRSAADGKDMAVYMKGNVTFADGSARKLAYQWAFVDEGTERKDTYKFELTKTKSPSDNRVIAVSLTQLELSNRFSLSGKSETTLKNPERTQLTTVKYDLEGRESGDTRTYQGTQSTAVKTTVDGKAETVTTTLTQDMKLTSVDGSAVLSGTAELETLSGKNEQTELTITFDDKPAEFLSAAAESGELYAVSDSEDSVLVTVISPETGVVQAAPAEAETDPAVSQYQVGRPPLGYQDYTSPAEMQSVDADSLTDQQRQKLADEMAQALAGKLLLALSALPEEDKALLSDGMTQEDYAAFVSLLNSL